MSLRALTWAMEHAGCPNSSAKLVLLAFANFANEQDHAYPTTGTIARLTKLDPKTVRAAIDGLEALRLLIDTGHRVGRTRQVKVYQLATQTPPIPEAFLKGAVSGGLYAGKASVFPAKGTQNWEAEPVMEPIPLTDPNGSVVPKGTDERVFNQEKRENGSGRSRAHRIPADWAPPPVDQLAPKAGALARQWPAGAYDGEAEAFVNYWLGEAGAKARKLNWDRTWTNWVASVSARVLRAAKAGVRHATPADAASGPPRATQPVAERAQEDRTSREIREALNQIVGAQISARYFDESAILVSDDTLRIVTTSRFASAYVDANFQQELLQAARRSTAPVSFIRTEITRSGRGRAVPVSQGETA
ncbi:MAG TPA: helix-turn-helix domain-containing protein [Sphingobium sp.]|nr:helix-turn-helix domain-containing protein [Sphingobium sp.]